MIRTAAILARGLGSRMRRDDASAPLTDAQATAADSGVKGMMPIAASADPTANGVTANGSSRPFLDYVISELADAGISDVVLVLGPEHDSVRTYYRTTAPPTRVRMRFALQQEPLGTANAVIAAADIIGERLFLVLNADNFYPQAALAQLAQSDTAATIAFDRDALSREGNIEPERVRAFAVLRVSADGHLLGIVEKPGASLDPSSPDARWVGMNCWAISPALVDACRRVPRSARGEFELPEAVALALHEGADVRAITLALPVLDLSQRGDIGAVSARLALLTPTP